MILIIKKQQISKYRDFIASTLLVLYQLLFVVAGLFNINNMHYILIIIGCFSVLLVKIKYKADGFVLLYFLIIYIALIASAIFASNVNMNGVIAYLHYFPLVFILLHYRINLTIIKISFYLQVLLLLYLLLSTGDLNTLILATKRNAISLFILTACALYYIAIEKNDFKETLMPGILGFLVSLLVRGRSGIISMSIMLIGVSISIFMNAKISLKVKKKSLLKAFILMMAATITIIYVKDINFNIMVYLDYLLTAGLKSSPRMEIILEYLDLAFIDGRSFLFGGVLSDGDLIVQRNFNLHNSYLSLHARFGITGLILIITLSSFSLIRFYLRKQYILLFLFIAILVRISTDSWAFIGIYDIFIHYFILRSFYPKTFT